MSRDKDKCEEAEYENIDKIGFRIKIESNIDDLLSSYEKDAIQTLGKISYSIESASIRFPLSEESKKAIVEKWIYLMEHKKENNENKNK